MTKKRKKPRQKAKNEKLSRNLLKVIEQFMTGKSFVPLTENELMERLGLPEQHLSFLQEGLNTLIELNYVEFKKERYSWKKSQQDVVTGILRMHPRGFGFLQPENPSLFPEDIFIPKHLTKNAIDGDVVEVLINNEAISEKGPEGRVIAILSRARTHLAGVIKEINSYEEFLAHVPLLGTQQRVIVQAAPEEHLKIGDRVVLEVIDWGSKETETTCRFSHHLGHISDPSCDVPAAIEEFELRADFPTRVIEEAEQLGKTVSRKDLQDREDLRHLITFTIDPDTAKDFDDALSLTKDQHGYYHLGVHIADVSHYVKPGTALDLEAQQRCNSTYFPGVCIPMLPPALSDNLCSLRPHVIRLTLSVLMRYDPQGHLLDYRFVRSYIKSSKRFTYKEAKKILDGEKASPHADTLSLMVELTRLLKQKRYERGSIEFALPELVILVDEKGVPYATDYVTYDITHQMVEEFMLKANETVAWDLSQKGKNLTYRIHDEPNEEHLRDFSLLAAAFGFRVPDKPTPSDLQKLFEEAGETTYGNYLASSYIRRMKMAAYSPENIGHYGLSLTHYCHFTSPIRRYVDLVVHRILFGESDDLFYLQDIANRCSEQERMSAKAENHVVLLKKLRLLHQLHQQEPYKEHAAIITRVKNFGIYFELIDFMLEGFLHISELEEDYFIFEEDSMRLRGSRTHIIYAAGNRLSVILKEIDFVSMETKWYMTANQPINIGSKTPGKQSKKKKRPDKGRPLLKKWAHKKSRDTSKHKKKKKNS
jgi:ribonuclease R